MLNECGVSAFKSARSLLEVVGGLPKLVGTRPTFAVKAISFAAVALRLASKFGGIEWDKLRWVGAGLPRRVAAPIRESLTVVHP